MLVYVAALTAVNLVVLSAVVVVLVKIRKVAFIITRRAAYAERTQVAINAAINQ